MAFTVSRSRICPMMAVVETAYGSGATDPAFAPAADGLLAYDSAVPISLDISRIELRPHGASFTHRSDIIAQRVAKLRFRCMLQGSGTAGDATIVGYKGFDALLQGCGVTSTDAGATLSYTPAAISALKSVAIRINMNGVVHTVQGAYGTFSSSGDPRNGNAVDFEFTGLYEAPLALTDQFDLWDGGAQRALGFLNLQSSTINNGSAYTEVLKSYRFAMNATIEPIDDANSATGMWGLVYADRAPTLNVVVGLDTDSGANIAYPEWFANCFAGTTHAVAWTQGTVSGNKWTQSFPTVQVVNVTPQASGAHRSISIDYKVQHATDNTEFTWTSF